MPLDSTPTPSKNVMLRKLGMTEVSTPNKENSTQSLNGLATHALFRKLEECRSPQPFGVPEGCILRNTFLEWQENEPENVNSGNDAYQAGGLSSDAKRRSKSCPEDVLKPRSNCSSPAVSCSPCTPEAGNGVDGDSVDSVPCRRRPLALDGNSEISVHGREDPQRPATYAGHGSQGHSPIRSLGNGSDFGQSTKPPYKGGRPTSSTAMVLRGLPFNVTEEDVASFIEQAGAFEALASHKPINLLSNGSGRPSGFAEIQLHRDAAFWEVQEKLHMQRLGGRYIEVLPPRSTGSIGTRFGGTPSSRHGKRDRGERGDRDWRR